MAAQSKRQSFVRDPGPDSEQLPPIESCLDLGWTAGATSKVPVLLRPQRVTGLPGASRGFGSLRCCRAGGKPAVFSARLTGGRTVVGRLISSLMLEDSQTPMLSFWAQDSGHLGLSSACPSPIPQMMVLRSSLHSLPVHLFYVTV